MTAAQPLLAAEGVCAGYGQHPVLHGVDLEVGAGESVALLGRNGMGKTTTIRALIGLTPISGGSVRLDGRPVSGLPPHRIARLGVGLVPEGRGIFPNLTVSEHLAVAVRSSGGIGPAWDRTAVLDLFPRLAERLAHLGTQLSGGEQQMLAIGRALMTGPRLLILDEATEGLAPRVRAEIWSVLARIRGEGVAILIVDRDLSRLLHLCDRAAIVVKGRIAFQGTAAALAADRAIQHRWLGV